MNKRLSILVVIIVLFITLIFEKEDIRNVSIDKKIYQDGNGQAASEYLISKANGLEVTEYINGNTTEMYTFEHEATEQTEALIDYRYIGDSSNNYIYFNCVDDSDTSTCEVWRIIGVFEVEDENGNKEQRVKIIRNRAIGVYAWDKNNVNEWSTSTLSAYLNSEYFSELSNVSQQMIGSAKYYLGGSSNTSLSAQNFYKRERGTNVYSNHSKNWIGKVSLMYPSDYAYTYALGIDDKCYNDTFDCNKGTPTTGWIYNSNIDESESIIYQWMLSPSSYYSYVAYDINPTGYAYDGIVEGAVSRKNGVRPVVYLIYNSYIIKGDGSEENPYFLSLEPQLEDENIKDNNSDNILDEDDLEEKNNGLDEDDLEEKNNELDQNVTEESGMLDKNINNESTVVNVGNTLSTISNVVLIISLMLIICGTAFLGYSCINGKKNLKK